MACECRTADSGSGVNGPCKLVVSVESWCEEVNIGGDGEEGGELVGGQRSARLTGSDAALDTARVRKPARTGCRVIYEVMNGPTSTVNITEFSNGADSVVFVNPIPPGNADIAVFYKENRTCETRRSGSAKGIRAAGGGVTVGELKVCVLTVGVGG